MKVYDILRLLYCLCWSNIFESDMVCLGNFCEDLLFFFNKSYFINCYEWERSIFWFGRVFLGRFKFDLFDFKNVDISILFSVDFLEIMNLFLILLFVLFEYN